MIPFVKYQQFSLTIFCLVSRLVNLHFVRALRLPASIGGASAYADISEFYTISQREHEGTTMLMLTEYQPRNTFGMRICVGRGRLFWASDLQWL